MPVMDAWELEFYTTARGSAPVREYLASLSKKEEARIARTLVMLERLGTQLGMPQAQKLQGSPLWELRIRGRTQHRVFYVAIHGRRILLLHAFEKKSQRTPLREIQTAEQRLRDYQERIGR